MVDSSSCDLHPTNGGRFVLTRVGEDPPEYVVAIYLPEGERMDTRLRWEDGQAMLDPSPGDKWARTEALKLARVLRRGTRTTLTRWRAR